MKINNSNLKFTKILRAQCAVLKGEKPIKCSIYELEPNKDKDYFVRLQYDKNWDNNKFLDDFDNAINSQQYCSEKVYVIEENETQKCLGACSTYLSDRHDSICIDYIESLPKRKELRYGYIGQSMISFLTKVAKNKNKSSIRIGSAIPAAWKFYYDRCGFNPVGRYNKKYSAELPNYKFDSINDKTKKYTGHRMSLFI